MGIFHSVYLFQELRLFVVFNFRITTVQPSVQYSGLLYKRIILEVFVLNHLVVLHVI